VGGGGDLRQALHDLHIGAAIVEIVVAREGAEGLAAQLAEFGFVDLLEQRALVPGGVLVLTQHLAGLVLGDVQHPDFQVLTGGRIHHQIVQAAPSRFQGLEIRMVDDLVDLLGELSVNRGDHAFQRQKDIVADHLGVSQRLLRQGLNRLLDPRLLYIGIGLEFFLQQRREIAFFGFNCA